MRYITLLRGINVGGHKKIGMDGLKSLYQSLRFSGVTTYIQSGNVIFSSASKNTAGVINIIIEKAICQKYGFDVPVQIRTSDELALLVKYCPFGPVNMEKNGAKVLLAFLPSLPSQDAVLEIQKHVFLPEKLVVKGKNIYLYCPHGYGKSRLSNTFLESILHVKATTRNWKTVSALHEMSQS